MFGTSNCEGLYFFCFKKKSKGLDEYFKLRFYVRNLTLGLLDTQKKMTTIKDGGCLYAYDSEVKISNCYIKYNKLLGNTSGGAIFIKYSATSYN